MTRLAGLAGVVAALSAAPAAPLDWPCMSGGNTERNGYLAVVGPASPGVKWSGTRPAIWGFPIAVEGSRLVTSRPLTPYPDSPSLIVVQDVETGQEIWARDLPPAATGGYAAHAIGMSHGIVYATRAGQLDEAGPMYALDAADGSVRWISPLPIEDVYAYAGIAFADDGDPIAGRFSSVVRFDSTSGAVVWNTPLNGIGNEGMMPVVHGDRTYVWELVAGTGSLVVTALDTATGARRYQAPIAQCAVCAQQNALFVGHDGTVYAPRTNTIGQNVLVALADTGAALVEKWRVPLANVAASSFGVGPDGSVYSYTDDFRLVRRDPATGAIRNATAEPLTTNPNFLFPRIAIDAGGRLYVAVAIEDNRILSFEPDLTLRWSDSLYQMLGGPALTDSGLLLAAGSGTQLRAYQTPAVSVGDATVVEGDEAGARLEFPVSLPVTSAVPVLVSFATADASAIAGLDYVATAGTLTLPVGWVRGTASVPVVGDVEVEGAETLSLRLVGAVGASIADGEAIGTIDDDDPKLSMADCVVTEGDAGASPCVGSIVLTGQSDAPVTLHYATFDETAMAGQDYVSVSANLTFAPHQTVATVAFQVSGDARVEGDETFRVLLDGIVGAFGVPAPGRVTILDDDAPSLSTLELGHGSDETRSLVPGALGEAPESFFRIGQPSFSSWEVLAEGLFGEVTPLSLTRLAADNATTLQTALDVGLDTAKSLRWENPTAATVTSQHVRVGIAGCLAGCAQSGGYRLRAVDTTLRGARFNNTGGQRTVAILQNASASAVRGTLWFWEADGSLRQASPFTLATRASFVLDTAGQGLLAGRSGSLTVSHDAPYGTLTGKTVIVDPAAGFSFDSPLMSRDR